MKNGDRAMPECLAAFTIIAEIIENQQPGNITWIRENREDAIRAEAKRYVEQILTKNTEGRDRNANSGNY